MNNIVLDSTQRYPLIHRVQTLTQKHNKNFLTINVGMPGSGKSESGMRLSELIDPDFNVEKIAFKGADFIKLISDKNIKKGSAIIFDEAGLGVPSREWYSFSNKAIGQIMQSFRYKNLVVTFTVPSFGYIDSQSRKLFNFYQESKYIDRNKGLAIAKPFFLSYNPLTDEPYKRYPLMGTPGQRKLVQIREVAYHRPSKALRREYVKLKDEYLSEKYEKMSIDAVLLDGVGGKQRAIDTYDRVKEAILQEPEKFTKYSSSLCVRKINKKAVAQGLRITSPKLLKGIEDRLYNDKDVELRKTLGFWTPEEEVK